VSRVAFISASLGRMDSNIQHLHAPQSIPVDFFYYDDANTPARTTAMKPRLQAKIPKMLGFEMEPGYEYYVWADAVITLRNHQCIEAAIDRIEGKDILLFRHQDGRKSVEEELDFMIAHMNGETGNEYAQTYLNERYESEPIVAQVRSYLSEEQFEDNKLYSAGFFVYKNTARMRRTMKEWFYECARWSVQDQLSLPFVLSNNDIDVETIDEEITNNSRIEYHWRNESNAGKWNNVYEGMSKEPSAKSYVTGDAEREDSRDSVPTR
jgi:hypothetical protein